MTDIDEPPRSLLKTIWNKVRTVEKGLTSKSQAGVTSPDIQTEDKRDKDVKNQNKSKRRKQKHSRSSRKRSARHHDHARPVQMGEKIFHGSDNSNVVRTLAVQTRPIRVPDSASQMLQDESGGERDEISDRTSLPSVRRATRETDCDKRQKADERHGEARYECEDKPRARKKKRRAKRLDSGVGQGLNCCNCCPCEGQRNEREIHTRRQGILRMECKNVIEDQVMELLKQISEGDMKDVERIRGPQRILSEEIVFRTAPRRRERLCRA